MWRATFFLIILCLGLINGERTCLADDEAEIANAWAEKLHKDARQLFETGKLEPIERAHVCQFAAYALALVGRSEQAISLSKENLDEADLAMAYDDIADAQSMRDDVEGAQRTANLLPNERRVQRAREIIAIRQAQRGDIADSLRLLAKLSNPDGRYRVRSIIISELLEAQRYREALAQYSLVKGEDKREGIRQEMESMRKHVEPGDPDYIETTVATERHFRGRFGRFSADDAKLVRFECQARVAIHENAKESFHKAIDDARRLIVDWDTGYRCMALLSLGTICTEFAEDPTAKEFFRDAFDALFAAGKPDIRDSHYKVHFGLAAGDYFESITKVMSDAELRRLSERLVSVNSDMDLLGALGRGLSVNGKMNVAQKIYENLTTDKGRVQFSTGVLVGITRRMRRVEPTRPRKPTTEADRKRSLAIIDRIIADKPPLKFVSTGKQRPKREYRGLYNVSRKSVPDYDGEIWQEAKELPELTLEEFTKVRYAVVWTLWGHGSVYGFPTIEGDHDFFVWDDKFSDRTQTIEVEASDHLAEILPAAVARLQQVLAEHSNWRVRVLGRGKNAKDEFFMIYPDAIRVLQASETNSMTEAIEANAKLRKATDR